MCRTYHVVCLKCECSLVLPKYSMVDDSSRVFVELVKAHLGYLSSDKAANLVTKWSESVKASVHNNAFWVCKCI